MKYLISALIASFFSLLIINPAQAQLATDLQCANCVGTPDIQGGAVTTGKIAPGAVTTARMAPFSVGTGKIQDSAVSSGKLKDFAVGTVKIKSQAITTGKLKDGAVTADKLDPALQATIADLEAQIAQMAGFVAALQAYMVVDDETNPEQPVVQVIGANLQIINGVGETADINGTGNLIVGYDEANGENFACSVGVWADQESCEADGQVWAADQKDGSHNIVVGVGHSYPSYGGIVAGESNVVNGELATAAGYLNVAAGLTANVNGGAGHVASGVDSTVNGGNDNTASGDASTVGGGAALTASGFEEWVAPVILP